MRIDSGILKRRIGNRWLELYEYIAPELGEAIDQWGKHVWCPIHTGNNGDAFRLFPDADSTGGGVCNTCGKFADGIALLMAVKNWTFPETVDAIEEWLVDHELDDDDVLHGYLSQQPTKDLSPPAPDPWVASYIKNIRQTAVPGHKRIIQYYQHRGLRITPSCNLGYLASSRCFDEYGDELYLPAMVGVFVAPDCTRVCIHRTYLDPGGSGKADIEPAKKFSRVLYPGALRGAAIRLRAPATILGVAEGIETAEAAFQATGTPVWAIGSSTVMPYFVPPRVARQVDIWADNDRNGVGQKSAATLALNLFDAGIAVRVLIPPHPGIDWLDILNQEGDDSLCQASALAPLYEPATTPRTKIIEFQETIYANHF